MNPDASPFTPRKPAKANLFVGREDHIKDLLAAVRRAKRGDITAAWIGGERGIGKSSLAAFAGIAAEKNENALFAHVPLGGANSLADMAKATYYQLLEDNRAKAWGKTLWQQFGKRVEEVGMFGVKFRLNLSSNDLPTTMTMFAKQLAHLAAKSGRDAMTLVFDDINGIAGEKFFAHGIKSMIDGLSIANERVPVCMIFVGLEERLEEMRTCNPSVVRCFGPLMRVKLWNKEESADFFRRAFKDAGVSTDDLNIKVLALLCGGMPTIAHELGDAVWRVADNKQITRDQMIRGIDVAMHSIGERFLQPEIIKALQSKNRSILGKIAAKSEEQFTKKELIASEFLTDSDKKALDAFLKRMRTLGGVIPVEGKQGVYRFPSEIYRIYYAVEGKKWILSSERKDNKG